MVKGNCYDPVSSSFMAYSKVIHDDRYQISYNVGVLLGKGGFAQCFQVNSDGDDFAMKIIDRKRLGGHTSLTKIKKEIAIHYKLRHPHIVTLYRSFEDEFNVYMLLEYCPNGTLLDHLQFYPGGTLPETDANIYLRQLLKAVNYLHDEVGIIHRDIKPGNILLSKDMSIKLADFGFASFMAENSNQTTHSVCGTPNYIAPEVIDKQGHSRYSEYWAIGCTFYCMLCGKPPFDSDSLESTYNRIRKCLYCFPNYLPISPKAMDFIQRILQKNPLDRMTISDMFKHSLFAHFNRSSSHASGLNGNLEGSRMRTTSCIKSISPKSHVLKPKRSSKLLDSGFESDHSEGLNKFLATLMGKYISILRDLASTAPSLDLIVNPEDGLPPSFIVKWVDYSNKYGFACTMRNGTRSMLYNDHSTLMISSDSRVCSYRARKFSDDFVEFHPFANEMQQLNSEISNKLEISHTLCSYMDRELSGSVIIEERASSIEKNGHFSTNNPYIVDYMKFTEGLIMLLSDGSCQINLSKSHIKFMMRRVSDDYILTALIPNKGYTNYYVRSIPHGTPCAKPSFPSRYRLHIDEFYHFLQDFSKKFLHQTPVIYSTDC